MISKIRNWMIRKALAMADQPNTITTAQDLDRWIRLGWISSSSGINVNMENAAGLAAMATCERVLTQAVAHLPLVLYRRSGERKVPDRNNPLFTLLHDRPNPWQTSYGFRKLIMRDMMYRGGFYVMMMPAVSPRWLVRLHPDMVTPEQDERTMEVTYTYRRPGGMPIMFRQNEILKVVSYTDDGFTPISPISAYRESIGDGIAIRQHGSSFFARKARLSGVLQMPKGGTMKQEAREQLLADFENTYSGNDNAFRTALLPGGITFEPVSVTMEDAQWVEARKITAREIFGIYGIPLHKGGDYDKATFNNVEHMNLDFVIDALTPWLVCFEQALNKDILDNDSTRYFKFNVSALLRGAAKDRAEALQIQRRNGVINANEWRALEDMNPRQDPGGDEYIVEQNMRIQDGINPLEVDLTPIGGTSSYNNNGNGNGNGNGTANGFSKNGSIVNNLSSVKFNEADWDRLAKELSREVGGIRR